MHALTTLLCLSLATRSAAQVPATFAERLATLERRVAGLERARWSSGPAILCLDVGSDLSPIHPTRAFPDGVRELSLVIEAGAAARFRELTAVFVAADVGAAAPPGTEMARAVQPAEREERARFRYRQEPPLPPGLYRVDVLGDGEPWQTLRYRVLPPDGFECAELALEVGRAWRYDFVQQAAPGARLVDGEAPAGSELRATVELRVVEVRDGEARLEFRRDGALVAGEWWRSDERGLVATRRGLGQDEVVLDPPQLLLAPGGGTEDWEWTSALGTQLGRQWGPLELEGPWGHARGQVVRTEQAEGELLHVAEREFVPGLGLVRERITTARGGHLLARQELVLQAPLR